MKHILLPEQRCGNCKYFMQHYTLVKHQYKMEVHAKVLCGHCTEGKIKKCDQYKKACETWEQIQETEDDRCPLCGNIRRERS